MGGHYGRMAHRHIDRTWTGPAGNVHLVADVNTGVRATKTPRVMETARSVSRSDINQSTKERADMTEKDVQGLSNDELEEQVGEQLPDREQMSLINANVAAPINAAVALNALSDGSVAYASATQDAPIVQSN